MKNESKKLIIKGKPITGEYKQHYYSNGLYAALADFFTRPEIERILEISFNTLFIESKYLSEDIMKDRLFAFVLENANKIRSSESVAGQIKGLSHCYNYFWAFPKIRPVIALTNNLENYPYALVVLADYIFYLESVKDFMRAKIVEGIRSNCERYFHEQKKNSR